MLDWLALSLQAVSGPVLPIDDRLRAVPACPNGSTAAEVVVCGRRGQPYRLEPLPGRRERSGPTRAETSIGPGRIGVEGESVTIGGVPSNRIMVRLKLPL